MRAKKAEYTPAVNDRVIAEDAEGRVVAVSEQRRTATILTDDGKTLVAAWEDIVRVEGEEGAERPHVPHEGRQRAPRERTPRDRAPRERSERGVRREQDERTERPAKNTGERRRAQGGKRRHRHPRPARDEASHE